MIRDTQAWWMCKARLGNYGDARFPHGAVAWVDLERAEGLLVPAEDRYPMNAPVALMPAPPPERAVLRAYWSRPLPAGIPAPGSTTAEVLPKPPASEPLCGNCRLSELQPSAADVIDGSLRHRPRWELRYPPSMYSLGQGERESGDRVELLPGGLEVVSGDDSAGLIRDGKLSNRRQTLGFPSGGWNLIWFQRPRGGFRLIDDGGWYITLDANLHRTDPLWPHQQLSRATPRLADQLPTWSKFALFGWVLLAFPIGIVVARRHGKLRRKKLVGLMHEVPAKVG